VAANDTTIVANDDDAEAPAEGAPTAVGEDDEQLAPSKHPLPIARCSVPGGHGGSVEEARALVGAANVAAGDGAVVVAVVNGATDVWLVPSFRGALVNDITTRLGGAVWRMSQPAISLAPTNGGVQSMSIRKSKWDKGGVESSANEKWIHQT
jgi:hypothetical protein